MSQEWKLVPVELLERLISATKVARGEGSPTQRDAEAILAAAPVPPAGGEVEVLGYRYHHPDTNDFAPVLTNEKATEEDRGGWEETELVDRAHVTRLQAEVVRIKREEKNDKIAYDAVLQRQNEIRAERDAIKAEVKRLHGRIREEQTYVSELAAEHTAMQSELTKARECIADLYKCGQKQDWVSRYPAEFGRAKSILAHQSAPAAKGGE